jgi:hypothetical protein
MGVEAVVADRMASWVRDLHEDPGHEVHGVDPLVLGQLGLVVPSLACVDDFVPAGVKRNRERLTGGRIM